MNSVRKYYGYLLKTQLISWRMLAVAITTVLTMDTFLADVRKYCHAVNTTMSQWGFAVIWNNKYVGLCFLLIYVFAIAVFPRDREKERYIVSRLGISKWILGQGLYIVTFGWLYTFFLCIILNVLLANVMQVESVWGKGWAALSNSDVTIKYQILISTDKLVISNYEPLYANLLVIAITGLLSGMLGMLVFCFNFYSKMAGALAASAVIFLSLAARKNSKYYRFSPVSWIQLDNHYRTTEAFLPTVEYMVGMLILLTLLFWLLAKIYASRTQENNRRNRA